MKSQHGQRGYLLVTVIVTLFLIASIAMLLAHDSSSNANSSNRELETARAEYLAQAGMQHALWRAQNNACRGDAVIPVTTLGDDSYTASITGAAAGTSFVLNADQDAWIRSDDITRNNGTGGSNHVKFENGNVEQVLTRFDISSLPSSAQVSSATAWFHLKALKQHPEGRITVHEITADWDETGVTWESFEAAYLASALAVIPAQDSGDAWVALNVTGLVQAWVNGQPNNGILFDSTAEGLHTEYTAREDGTNPPRLEVTIGSGQVNPVVIESVGTLVNGVSRTYHRAPATAYQPAVKFEASPNDGSGQDTMMKQDSPGSNLGANDNLWVQDTSGGNGDHSLLQFDLSGLPSGARVISASLSLHQHFAGTPGGTVSAHRITREWDEGTEVNSPGDGVTWITYDWFGFWSDPGGDYEPQPAAVTEIASATVGRIQWDVTGLVAGWVRRDYPNHGLILVSGAPGTDVGFNSSDDVDTSLHPRLTVSYACECGSACLAPKGTGRIALIGDDWTPDPDDQIKIETLESWGYEVDFYQDRDSGWINWSNYDLAYVSGTVVANDVNANLANLSIGVVNEEPRLYDDLQLATGDTEHVGSSIDITDNSHFITSVFASGPLSIYTGGMEILTADTPLATGLQTLAEFNGAASLTATDRGVQTIGGTAAGRRVTLPLGRHSVADFDWKHLGQDGHLLVQRSIAWGMNADFVSIGDLLMVVGNAATPVTRDQDRQALFESWGYTVTLIDDGASQADFDTAAAANDVIYVTASIGGGTLADKLTGSVTPIVSEFGGNLDDFGFSSSTGNTVTADLFTATNTSHYIGEPFSGAAVTQFTSNITMPVTTGTLAPGLLSAAELGTLTWALPTLEAGGERWDGQPAPARRVHLPFGAANINQLTPDGQTLMKRSIDWAGGAGPKYGLIAHWKLDETSGTTAVDSEGGHDGTLLNGPAWSDGIMGGSVQFSDETHAISAPHSDSLTITGDLTLMAWVNLDELRPNRPIVQKGTNNTNHNYYLGLSDDSMQFAVSPPGGGWHVKVSGPTGILPGSWHHLAVSFNDSTDEVAFYLDGALFATNELTHSPSEFAGPVRIGRNDLNYGIKGRIDDARIYRRTLSEAEISELATPPPLLPVAHWKMDDVAGLTATDSVGGHDGTLVNGPAWAAGNLDGGLFFDGANDYVNVPHDDALSITEKMSFTAWINATSFGSSYQTIVAKDGGGAGSNYYFGTWRDELVFGFFSGGLFREVFTTGLDLPAGIWLHLAATFDNSTNAVALYANGILVHSGSLNFNPTIVSADLRMGLSPDGERWRGLLDDVRIYDDILGATEIAQLAGGSGGGGGGGGSCDGTFRDEFNAVSYAGSDGTEAWATNWLEINENGNVNNGDEKVDDNDSNYHLQVRDNDGGGEGVQREADLSAFASATLSFEYRRDGFDNPDDYVMVHASSDGGANWTELDRFVGPGTDSAYVSTSYDISAHVSSNTRIRFLTSPDHGSGDEMYIDNVEIAVSGCANP